LLVLLSIEHDRIRMTLLPLCGDCVDNAPVAKAVACTEQGDNIRIINCRAATAAGRRFYVRLGLRVGRAGRI
jgi:hypothetical protein